MTESERKRDRGGERVTESESERERVSERERDREGQRVTESDRKSD